MSEGVDEHKKFHWVDHLEVQELLAWLEQCTLAELILAKEFVEKYRGKSQ